MFPLNFVFFLYRRSFNSIKFPIKKKKKWNGCNQIMWNKNIWVTGRLLLWAPGSRTILGSIGVQRERVWLSAESLVPTIQSDSIPVPYRESQEANRRRERFSLPKRQRFSCCCCCCGSNGNYILLDPIIRRASTPSQMNIAPFNVFTFSYFLLNLKIRRTLSVWQLDS